MSGERQLDRSEDQAAVDETTTDVSSESQEETGKDWVGPKEA